MRPGVAQGARLHRHLRRQPPLLRAVGVQRRPSLTLQRDGTVRSGPGAPGLGTLWYKARPYGDFSSGCSSATTRRAARAQQRRPGPVPRAEGSGAGLRDESRSGRPVDRGALRPRDPDQRHARTATRARRARSTASPTSTPPRQAHAGGRLERPGDQGRRPDLHDHPQRRGHQRVRERARHPVPGPPRRSRAPAAAAWSATSASRPTAARRRRVVPQHPRPRPVGRVAGSDRLEVTGVDGEVGAGRARGARGDEQRDRVGDVLRRPRGGRCSAPSSPARASQSTPRGPSPPARR